MESKERTTSFYRFEDLRIYGKAIDYSQWVLTTLKEASTKAEKELAKGFCNSAFAIGLNIAEGSSRNKAQFEHYLKISKTAIRECVVFTEIAFKTGMLTDTDYEASRNSLMELTRMIGALIISLQHGSRRHKDEETSSDDENNGVSNSDIDDFDTDFQIN
ncbi:MAG: four helix bundle protein [Bacteroidales bacterium]|nr:four helix bundle protein [Bacteroidales bacterium]